VGQRTPQRIEFGRHQRPGAGHRRGECQCVEGAFLAVCGAEGVVDVDVDEAGDAGGEPWVIGLLADIAPAVLEQHQLARTHAEAAVGPVLDQRHGVSEQ